MSAKLNGLFGLVCGLVLVAVAMADGSALFRAKTADKYPTKQKQGAFIVAVRPFVTEKDQKSAFGGVRPTKHGVTPLLVVMTNTGRDTFSLENLKVRLITADGVNIEPVSAQNLETFNPGGHQPKRRNIPGVPGLSRTRVTKGPLNRPVIADMEFRVPILTPKSTASGFLYFETGPPSTLAGASAYLAGIYDMTNGRDLFYFEISLGKKR